MFGTLIADNEGVYDPRLYNDRLLLGLKGTMSEAELHLLRQRLDAGRMNQVKRGAYQQHLPAGFRRLVDGTEETDRGQGLGRYREACRRGRRACFSRFVTPETLVEANEAE